MAERICSDPDCAVSFVPRGGRHRYCDVHGTRAAQRQRETVIRTCAHCGTNWSTRRQDAKLCSDTCRSAYYRDSATGFSRTRSPLPPEHPVMVLIREQNSVFTQKSALRTAIEEQDHLALINEIQKRSSVSEQGCWEWQGTINKNGYPSFSFGSRRTARSFLVHRLVLEAKYQAPLGEQAAHHACANTSCVNPDHLQPVTARENIAEMLARTYLVNRIRSLEKALAGADPGHPLLREIGVADTA